MRVLTLAFVALAIPALAQRPGFAWDVGTEQGRIFKHSPKIAFAIPAHTYGVGIHFQYQTNGKREWHQHHRYPLLGFSMQYFNFGNEDALGQAISFYPNITLKILERSRWMAHFRMGSGVAWLSRPYDRLENPENTAIGSHLNNTTCFRLAVGWRLAPQWTIFAGGSFTHFSNGAAQMPNLGINVPAWSGSVRYMPQPVEKAAFARWDAGKRPSGRWGGQGYYAMAYKETSFPGGAKWPVYASSAAGLYRINKVQNLLFGVEYEYHKSIYLFSRHTFASASEEEARRHATRWMIFLANEWLYGNIGLLIQAGFYVSKDSALLPFPVYNRLGLRYYLPPVGRPATQFFFGIYLKSHLITADYISIGVGARIQ